MTVHKDAATVTAAALAATLTGDSDTVIRRTVAHVHRASADGPDHEQRYPDRGMRALTALNVGVHIAKHAARITQDTAALEIPALDVIESDTRNGETPAALESLWRLERAADDFSLSHAPSHQATLARARAGIKRAVARGDNLTLAEYNDYVGAVYLAEEIHPLIIASATRVDRKDSDLWRAIGEHLGWLASAVNDALGAADIPAYKITGQTIRAIMGAWDEDPFTQRIVAGPVMRILKNGYVSQGTDWAMAGNSRVDTVRATVRMFGAPVPA